jgi:hypothetical protein
MSWSEGRYHSRTIFTTNTIRDLVALSPADLSTLPMVLPAAELRSFGMALESAGPTSPFGGTLAIISIDRLNVNAAWGAAVGNRVELGTITVPLDAAQYAISEISLDANASDIHLPAAFPKAYYGDRMIIELKTQGASGTQSVRTFFKYRELENRTDEVDRPTA